MDSVSGDIRQLLVGKTDPQVDPRWAAFVERHPAGSIYHHPNWLRALEREYRRKAVCLICEDRSGQLQGVFPLMYTRGVPFSRGASHCCARLASLPRTPLAGPLALHPQATALLVQEAKRRASQRPCVPLQIKPQGRDLREIVDGIIEKPWRYTYLLHLGADKDAPFHVADRKHRAKINGSVHKAVATGLSARLAETEADLEAWYRAYLETMRRNVVPARPYRFFLALWQLMRPAGQMRLWLAEHKSETGISVVGGHIYFYFGQTMYYGFNGVCSNALCTHANDLLLWQAINDAQREGLSVVDFGEVPEGDESLARFKLKWGAEPVRLYRYYYPMCDKKMRLAATESNLVAAGKALWRHLPLNVTARIGDQIYSRL
jgi:hypothetical protein